MRYVFISSFQTFKNFLCPKGDNKAYNPSTAPLLPVDKGVLAGSAYNGSDAYVGLVNVTCNGIDTGVARLSSDPLKAGAFYPCKGPPAIEKFYRTSGIFYVLYHPNISWKKMTLSTLKSSGLLTFSTNYNTLGYGRYFHPDGFVIIGQV